MILLGKGSHEGYTRQSSLAILGGGTVMIIYGAFFVLTMDFSGSYAPSPKSFTSFVGIEVTPAIAILHNSKTGYDEFESYTVCFQTSEDVVQKIVHKNSLKPDKKISSSDLDIPAVRSCLKGEIHSYISSDPMIDRSLLYNPKTQTAWFHSFGTSEALKHEPSKRD